ncbi:MAG: 1-deoxy-D-xylulose-5-phosphate synthase [Ruminococcaceae bacterium]|nr:1-deoxy-D-xylulose-5-phosphate synthase [Oscillospiraceae bacterium]
MNRKKAKNTSMPAKARPLLPGIHSPQDLKALSEDQMPALCEEIRQVLVETVTSNGGHLASNLGVVELSVAMHRVFDCPHDHFIFDVGHQSYVHKLLTGRYESFSTLRRAGGISGFTKRSESEYDCFGAGHSSTSLSAALGFAKGDRLKGSDAFTLAVVGDGAFTGGMIHEALNNVSRHLRLIIIINENEMSISKNVGRFATHMSKMRRKAGYFKAKKTTARILTHIPLVGKAMFRGLVNLKKTFKNALYGSNYFEDMGLYYLGPADGNDYKAVERLLTEAKNQPESCVVHIKTRKGKGYAPAEADPGFYHGMAPGGAAPQENFSVHLGQILTELGQEDKSLCAITASMSEGTGLESFRAACPHQFFDVGIAEEHALTFAAGLAANGLKPVTAIYSSFMQRAYDQIIHDIALQKLPVLMCIDRAGLSAADGATHHGIFDVAFLSEIPGIDIYTPVTFEGLSLSVRKALQEGHPAAIRYPNGGEDIRILKAFYPEGNPTDVSIRANYTLDDTLDGVIITHGRITGEALRACELARERGLTVGMVLCEYIKPYDKLAEAILPLLPPAPIPVLFVEEEIYAGGFGMMLSDTLCRISSFKERPYRILAACDSFVIQTRQEPIYKTAGVDAETMVQRLIEMVKKHR